MPCVKPTLLVEDDPVDALAIRRAFRDVGVADVVIHASCAREALAYLHSSENRPAMILLDLSMPDTDGLEFLEVIKSDPSLRDIPVIALTGSSDPRHILSSFDLGVAGYMIKSPSYDALVETLRAVRSYWTLSELPRRVA